MENKYKREVITDSKDFFNFMAITETNYHYNGDGQPTYRDPVSGANIAKTVVGRIKEILLLDEYSSKTDPLGMKHFNVKICVEVSTDYSSGQYKATSSSIFQGEPDKPETGEARSLRDSFPFAWTEFISHRGYIYHAGQWIKSVYTIWREEQEKLEQEALNSLKKPEEVKKNAVPTKK
jgi:hypothetical protein